MPDHVAVTAKLTMSDIDEKVSDDAAAHHVEVQKTGDVHRRLLGLTTPPTVGERTR